MAESRLDAEPTLEAQCFAIVVIGHELVGASLFFTRCNEAASFMMYLFPNPCTLIQASPFTGSYSQGYVFSQHNVGLRIDSKEQ